MSKRSDAKIEVGRIRSLFEGYMGKEMQMTFADYSFPIIISDIRLAKLGELENKPDVRIGEDKNYRPPVLEMETNAGMLYYVLEDITLTAITQGIQIDIGNICIQMRQI